MEVIKKKIASLKLEVSRRDDTIAEKERQLAKIEAENEIWEKKNADLQANLDKIDTDLDSAEEEYLVVQKQLAEAIKDSEMIEREHRQMKNRTANNANQIDTQTEHLERAKQIAEEADQKYEEAAAKLKVLEDDIEDLEREAEKFEIQNVELSGESKLMTSTLKSFQAMKSSMTDKEQKAETDIECTKRALEESQAACEEMIAKRDKLNGMLDDLEEELGEAIASKQSAVESLDATVRELGSI